MTYTRVNGFRPHRDSLFRGGGNLYAGATYTQVYMVDITQGPQFAKRVGYGTVKMVP